MKTKLARRLSVFLFASVLLVGNPAWSESSYSIDLVKVSPKQGAHLVVGEHVVVSVTVKYKLTAADKGKVTLVVEKGDNSDVTPGQKQVQKEVSRGSGEVTLTDEFDVPAGTDLIRLFVPLVPQGFTNTSGEVVVEYPVKQK